MIRVTSRCVTQSFRPCKAIDYVRNATVEAAVSLDINGFAVSLPEFPVFDDDLEARHETSCGFLRALGWWGLGARARAELARVLTRDPAHQAARLVLRWGP